MIAWERTFLGENHHLLLKDSIFHGNKKIRYFVFVDLEDVNFFPKLNISFQIFSGRRYGFWVSAINKMGKIL